MMLLADIDRWKILCQLPRTSFVTVLDIFWNTESIGPLLGLPNKIESQFEFDSFSWKSRMR